MQSPAIKKAMGRESLFEDGCVACRSQKLHFDRARSFARYQGSLVRAMVLLKFEEMEPLADWFADRRLEVVRENGHTLEADVIIPVPLHKDSTARTGVQPGGIAVKTSRQTAQTAASGRFIGEKASPSG